MTTLDSAIGFGCAIAMVCAAGVVFAGSVPLETLRSPAASSGEIVEPPPNSGTLPTDLSSLLDPLPAGSQPSIEQLFQAGVGTSSSTTSIPSNAGPFDFLSGVWQSQNLLGDMRGLRPALSKYGVTLSITENAEMFGNVTGGARQGFEPKGLTTATLQLDTEKAFGLDGGQFIVSGLQIWGGLLSSKNLLVLQSASSLDAPDGVRLWELWYDQKFGGKFDIKIGEQSLDQEFIISPSANVFINSTFGWPSLPTVDLPASGPDYPLASLGVRGRVHVSDNVTVLAGVFNGSPIPRDSPNTPASNPYGVSFPLNTDVLAIAELQFMFPGLGDSAKAKDQGSLPGAYKIGAWCDSYKFDDLQYDNMGVPLASPASDGLPATPHGDFSIYGVVDQMIWRSKDDSSRNLNFFIRPMSTPFQDRNFVSFSVDAGLTMHGLFPGRDSDTLGLGASVAQASAGARAYARDLQFYQPSIYTPVPSAETFFEATYQAQVTPWWQIQPDVQYFVDPRAGIVNPNDPTQRVKNELVIGLRTNITF